MESTITRSITIESTLTRSMIGCTNQCPWQYENILISCVATKNFEEYSRLIAVYYTRYSCYGHADTDTLPVDTHTW